MKKKYGQKNKEEMIYQHINWTQVPIVGQGGKQALSILNAEASRKTNKKNRIT